jgi:nitrite reductase/ring-hydroxylating ferredoxin subunit
VRRLTVVEALPPGGALFFEALVRGVERPCVAVGTPRGPRAFLNVCAHRNQPVVVDDRPFDEAGLLECRAHGAKYAPDSGECIEGPCVGARLVPVALLEQNGALFIVDDDVVDDSVYADEG